MHRKEHRGKSLTINTARIIVGILFIFSGLVKANDPLGLSYKMQEFFDVWSQAPALTTLMHNLNNYALPFSIIMNTLEIVLGIALLVGWKPKLVSWLLLLLIIFFTFLTGYAVLSGKIRTCGCFGDCIPLTAVQSFLKDIILCILIIILVTGARFIHPVFNNIQAGFFILLSLFLVVVFQFYVLKHLPVTDCLPFKKGNNILELRKMPADAIPDKMDFIFIYSKKGQHKEFSKEKLPDSTWTFVKRQDIIIQKGKNNEPPVKDFYLNTLSGQDSTEALLSQKGKYYLLFIKDLDVNKTPWLSDFNKILEKAKSSNTPVTIVATQASEVNDFFNIKNHYNLQVLSCDATALKTASRTDPSLYLMKGPVVANKWGWANFFM